MTTNFKSLLVNVLVALVASVTTIASSSYLSSNPGLDAHLTKKTKEMPSVAHKSDTVPVSRFEEAAQKKTDNLINSLERVTQKQSYKGWYANWIEESGVSKEEMYFILKPVSEQVSHDNAFTKVKAELWKNPDNIVRNYLSREAYLSALKVPEVRRLLVDQYIRYLNDQRGLQD